MQPNDIAETPQVPVRRRGRRIAIALAGLAGAALGTAWLSRVPIASGVINRELARRGVPARYEITDLGFGRQRLTNVVIGDPRRPDLVADWMETVTDFGLGGPRLVGVRAGHVRLRARLVDGQVSLGTIDRLLPPPSGKPFALPTITAALEDARVRLETPYGVVGLALAGRGRLNDGWRGDLAAVAPRLQVGGCTLRGVDAHSALFIHAAAPELRGPVRADAIECEGARTSGARAQIAATLAPALDRWTGSAQVAVAEALGGGARLQRVSGRIGFAGTSASTTGPVALSADRFAAPQASGRALAVSGRWRGGAVGAALDANVSARSVALPEGWRGQLAALGDTGAGTPLAPLAEKFARSVASAAENFALAADLALGTGTAEGTGTSASASATIRHARLTSRNGANATFDGTGALGAGNNRIDGTMRVTGGGLPDATVRLTRAGEDGIAGTAVLGEYRAGNARLSLTPIHFAARGGYTTVATTATLSGPVGNGRVDRLSLPLDARWSGDRLLVNTACAPLTFDRLATGGMALQPARLTVCPTGSALVTLDGGVLGGGARIGPTRLAGSLGSTPLALAVARAEVRLRNRGFVARDVEARLGESRLAAGRLDGGITARGLAGSFEGTDGRIANVPLLLEDAAGQWQVAGGRLGLSGALRVRDAAVVPRFQPLAARNVTLALAGGRIDARGELSEPTRGVKVADVTIGHTLSSGAGSATLAVPGITFGEGFQPELLTRATFGVVADVRGAVRGEGRIAWDAAGVKSTGTFRTDNLDLAAAFGPVTGIKGAISFTDLLALQSAPDQVVTVASINPGVAVTDGRVVFQTLAGSRVAVRNGAWPFAGGTLTLEPTLLDFSSSQVRRMTFRVDGMDAGKFLQQFDFDNLNATGVFDGVLPMLFDESGGRIEGGRLTARPSGGGIAYVGELTQKQLGFWGDYAFRALRSLTYRQLDVTVDGPLAGEMVTEVRFAGVQQGEGTYSNFILRRLTRLPIVFNIRIRAPFRGLIDSAASFYDPKRLVQRNLQQLIEEQNRRTNSNGVQPPASETVP